MDIKASLLHNGSIIREHIFTIHEEGDMARGITETYALFRREYPHLSLFTDGVEVRFAKP